MTPVTKPLLLISGFNEDGDIVHLIVRVNAWEVSLDANGRVVRTPIYDKPGAGELRYSVSQPMSGEEPESWIKTVIKVQTRLIENAYAEDCAKWDAEEKAERETALSYTEFHTKLAARDWEGLGWFKQRKAA